MVRRKSLRQQLPSPWHNYSLPLVQQQQQQGRKNKKKKNKNTTKPRAKSPGFLLLSALSLSFYSLGYLTSPPFPPPQRKKKENTYPTSLVSGPPRPFSPLSPPGQVFFPSPPLGPAFLLSPLSPPSSPLWWDRGVNGLMKGCKQKRLGFDG